MRGADLRDVEMITEPKSYCKSDCVHITIACHQREDTHNLGEVFLH